MALIFHYAIKYFSEENKHSPVLKIRDLIWNTYTYGIKTVNGIYLLGKESIPEKHIHLLIDKRAIEENPIGFYDYSNAANSKEFDTFITNNNIASHHTFSKGKRVPNQLYTPSSIPPEFLDDLIINKKKPYLRKLVRKLTEHIENIDIEQTRNYYRLNFFEK